MMCPLVVLTGGIASGKSTAARRVLELGIPVVSADRIARLVVQPGMPLWHELRQKLGSPYFTKSNELNRAALRKAIFRDQHLKTWLEHAMHPEIRRVMLERAQSVQAPFVLLDIPLYAENPGWLKPAAVWVVDCPEAMQISRLIARDGCSPETAHHIVGAQASRQQRLQLATKVVDNAGSIKHLLRQIDKLVLMQLNRANTLDRRGC